MRLKQQVEGSNMTRNSPKLRRLQYQKASKTQGFYYRNALAKLLTFKRNIVLYQVAKDFLLIYCKRSLYMKTKLVYVANHWKASLVIYLTSLLLAANLFALFEGRSFGIPINYDTDNK